MSAAPGLVLYRRSCADAQAAYAVQVVLVKIDDPDSVDEYGDPVGGLKRVAAPPIHAIHHRSLRARVARCVAMRPDPANEPPTDDQEGLTASWRSGL